MRYIVELEYRDKGVLHKAYIFKGNQLLTNNRQFASKFSNRDSATRQGIKFCNTRLDYAKQIKVHSIED